MFFQIYGETAGWQLLGWLMVFVALIVKRSVEQKKNPYKKEIFTDTKTSNWHWIERKISNSHSTEAAEFLQPLFIFVSLRCFSCASNKLKQSSEAFCGGLFTC